MIDPLISRICF